MSSIKEILPEYEISDNETRQEVSTKLLEIGKNDLNQLVDSVYEEEKDDTLSILIHTLGDIGSQAVDSLLEMLEIDELRHHVKYAISSIRPIPTEKILTLLNDDNIKVRTASIEIIGRILYPFSELLRYKNKLHSEEQVDSLEERLFGDVQDKVEEVGLDNYNKFVDKLLVFLENEEDDDIKGHFAYNFGRLEEEKFIEPLESIIRTGKGTGYLLYQSASALAKYKNNSEILNFFLEILKDGTEEIREYVARALAELSDVRSLDHLREALDTTNSKEIRHEIHNAIDRMMWKIEYAKTCRAKCKKCFNSILNQELRVGEPYFYSGSLIYRWYHVDCSQLQNLEKQQLLGIEEISLIDKERLLSKCKK